MVAASASDAMARLVGLGVAVQDATPVPGRHVLSWTDFRSVFGFSPERATFIDDLHVALDAARLDGVSRAWVGGSLARFDKLVPGDVDVVLDALQVPASVHDALVAAHSVQQPNPAMRELMEARVNVLPLHAEGLAEEWLQFLSVGRDGAERGVMELKISDVPHLERPYTLHVHKV